MICHQRLLFYIYQSPSKKLVTHIKHLTKESLIKDCLQRHLKNWQKMVEHLRANNSERKAYEATLGREAIITLRPEEEVVLHWLWTLAMGEGLLVGSWGIGRGMQLEPQSKPSQKGAEEINTCFFSSHPLKSLAQPSHWPSPNGRIKHPGE